MGSKTQRKGRAGMKFGIFDHLDGNDLPLRDYYAARLDLAAMYDRLGFYGYHIAEHHGTMLGMAPSPNVFLAAVAERTTRLRFGPMVYALPLYHPLRLAQEICMLDQLSGGRLEIGFGRGSSPPEISFFGVNPGDTEAIYQDYLDRILTALETGTMQIPDQPEPYQQVDLKVAPWQRPYPPVWYGVHVPASAERAARRGWPTINLDLDDEARECNDAYRRVWRETRGAAPLPLLGLGRFIVVADTDAAALAIARRAYPVWHAGFTHLFRVLGRPQKHPRPTSWDALQEIGKGIAGTPDTVAAFLDRQMRRSQCNYCVGQFAFGNQAPAETQRSVTLFADAVMPALRDAEVLAEAG
jgi:alkanesulfonate monooxygenase SsuD/methylene tetrahydromethanopterin reductase-like flavin-dependent oxidoreductase (luciferase family)